MGPTGSGPICLPVVNTTSQVLQLETRPTSGGIGCIYPGLEQSEGICLPSLCSSGQMPQATVRPECAISGTASSSLAVPAVVSTPLTELYCSTSSVTSLSRPVIPPDRDAPIRQSPTSRLAAISQSYVKAGISQPAQELLLAAWRKGTTTTYASAWRKWDSWCCGRQINYKILRMAFILVRQSVLQGDCLSPLLFNMFFNALVQHIKVEKYHHFWFLL